MPMLLSTIHSWHKFIRALVSFIFKAKYEVVKGYPIPRTFAMILKQHKQTLYREHYLLQCP